MCKDVKADCVGVLDAQFAAMKHRTVLIQTGIDPELLSEYDTLFCTGTCNDPETYGPGSDGSQSEVQNKPCASPESLKDWCLLKMRWSLEPHLPFKAAELELDMVDNTSMKRTQLVRLFASHREGDEGASAQGEVQDGASLRFIRVKCRDNGMFVGKEGRSNSVEGFLCIRDGAMLVHAYV